MAIKDNPLKLAQDFKQFMDEALSRERDYFSENIKEYIPATRARLLEKRRDGKIDIYSAFRTDSSKANLIEALLLYDQETLDIETNDDNLYPLARFHVDSLSILQKRSHPFQEWIDNFSTYQEAQRIFKKKPIICPMSSRYVKRELPPIDLNSILDLLVANTIALWIDIKLTGIDKHMRIDNRKIEEIQRSANSLLTALNSVPYISIYSKAPLINGLEKLVAGVGLRKDDIHLAHIPKPNRKCAPNIKHQKSDREFIVSMFISQYMREFGAFEIINHPDYAQIKIMNSLDPFRVEVAKVFRPFNLVTKEPKPDNTGSTFILRKSPQSINGDVIAAILPVIDSDFEDISERKIFEYAKKLKRLTKS